MLKTTRRSLDEIRVDGRERTENARRPKWKSRVASIERRTSRSTVGGQKRSCSFSLSLYSYGNKSNAPALWPNGKINPLDDDYSAAAAALERSEQQAIESYFTLFPRQFSTFRQNQKGRPSAPIITNPSAVAAASSIPGTTARRRLHQRRWTTVCVGWKDQQVSNNSVL